VKSARAHARFYLKIRETTRMFKSLRLALLVLTITLVGASALSFARNLPRNSTQHPSGEARKKKTPPGARGYEQFAGRDASDKLISGAATRRSEPPPPMGGIMKRPDPAPAPVETPLAEAERQHAAGNFEAAVAAYRKAIELRKSGNRDDIELRYALGKVYRDMERYDDALAEFQYAATHPQAKSLKLAATYELGNAYLDVGKYAEAINAYEQTLKILNGGLFKSRQRSDRQYLPPTHYNLGLAHISLGQKEQAVADFKKAIELKDDFPEAYFNLGLTLWQSGQADAARATETKLRILNAELADQLIALFK
jgi:Flp pilus assembly protein TadD